MMNFEAGIDHFREDMIDLMVPVEGGTVELRDFININQWMGHKSGKIE